MNNTVLNNYAEITIINAKSTYAKEEKKIINAHDTDTRKAHLKALNDALQVAYRESIINHSHPVEYLLANPFPVKAGYGEKSGIRYAKTSTMTVYLNELIANEAQEKSYIALQSALYNRLTENTLENPSNTKLYAAFTDYIKSIDVDINFTKAYMRFAIDKATKISGLNYSKVTTKAIAEAVSLALSSAYNGIVLSVKEATKNNVGTITGTSYTTTTKATTTKATTTKATTTKATTTKATTTKNQSKK